MNTGMVRNLTLVTWKSLAAKHTFIFQMLNVKASSTESRFCVFHENRYPIYSKWQWIQILQPTNEANAPKSWFYIHGRQIQCPKIGLYTWKLWVIYWFSIERRERRCWMQQRHTRKRQCWISESGCRRRSWKSSTSKVITWQTECLNRWLVESDRRCIVSNHRYWRASNHWRSFERS